MISHFGMFCLVESKNLSLDLEESSPHLNHQWLIGKLWDQSFNRLSPARKMRLHPEWSLEKERIPVLPKMLMFEVSYSNIFS